MEHIMTKAYAMLLLSVFMSGLTNAQTLPNMRVRGTITDMAGQEMQVQTRTGDMVKINLTYNTRISELYARKLRDIKQGSFIGVTAIPQKPGSPLLAREVHIFAEAQRGTGEGHYGWDLEPGSSMTNANVDAIVNGNNGKELTLGYKGGSQKIVVPPGTPIISFKAAGKSALKAGAQIFCVLQRTADGNLTALHVSVGKNGMKPPM